MAQSAKKFTYTLQAVYEGKGEVKQLSTDLKTLSKIEALKGLEASFKDANDEFVEAKAKVRELRKEMSQPGGEAYAKSFAAAKINVDKLSKSLRVQKDKIIQSNTALKESGIDVTNLAAKYDSLKVATKKQGVVMAAMRKLGVKSFKDIASEAEGLRRAYSDLESSGTVSFRELSFAKEKMRGQIKQLNQKTNVWTSSVGKLKAGWVGVMGVVASAALVGRGVQLFAGFDDSMRSVKAVAGATAEEFQHLTAYAKEMGRTTRFSSTESAQGMEELAQAGMRASEIIATLPHAMNMAAISGGTVKESADQVTNTMKQFGIAVADTARVTDVLVTGYTNAGMSLGELGQAMSYAGPISASFGYSLEDTVAVLQTYAEAGFKGSRGGTAMVGALTRLIKPSKEAGAVLEKYSIQVFDSTGVVRNFADIIEDLGEAALSPTETMTLFGQEAGPGLVAVLSQGADAIRGFREDLNDVGGTAARIAGEMEAGLGGSLRSLWASTQAITIAFGSTFAPAIQLVANGLALLASFVSALPGPIKAIVGVVGLAVGAFVIWRLGFKHIIDALKLTSVDIGLLTQKMKLNILAARGNAAALVGVGKGALTALRGVKLLSAATFGWVLVAAQVGWAIGKWALRFDIVKKAGNRLAYALTIMGLRAKQAWAYLFGDADGVQQEIDRAKQIYAELYNEIGVKIESTAETANNAHVEITAAVKNATADQVKATQVATDKMIAMYDNLNAKAGTAKKNKVEVPDEFGHLKSERESMDVELAKLDAIRKKKKNKQVRDVEFVVDPNSGHITSRSTDNYSDRATMVERQVEQDVDDSNSSKMVKKSKKKKKSKVEIPDEFGYLKSERKSIAVELAKLDAIRAKKSSSGKYADLVSGISNRLAAIPKTEPNTNRSSSSNTATKKTIEIKFPSASLYGDEDATEKVIADLQRMGAMA